MRRTALPHSGRREAAALMSCVGKYYNPIINGKAGGPFSLHWSLGSVPVFPMWLSVISAYPRTATGEKELND